MIFHKRKTLFGLLSANMVMLAAAFFVFAMTILLVMEYLMTPYYYGEINRRVYETYDKAQMGLSTMILSGNIEGASRLVEKKQFHGQEKSKILTMFDLARYEKYGLVNQCRGVFKSHSWGNTCDDGEKYWMELPVKSADNTFALLLIEIEPDINGWYPYHILKLGIVAFLVITVGVTAVLLLQFYKRYSRPVVSQLQKMLRLDDELNYHELKQNLPIEEMYRMADQLEMYQHMASDNASAVAVGKMSSHIAHDMRSPISVLKSYVEVSKPASSEEKQFRDAAGRSVKKLQHMAEDLVDYAKAGKLEKSTYDISMIVSREVISEATGMAERHGVLLKANTPPHIYAYIDGYRIERMLVNMVSNAIKACSQNGVVCIFTEYLENVLIIRVSDTGGGIETSDMSKIFDSFFTKDKKAGTGLGLAYCKQVVEAHGGTIDVESEVGKGTTFTIRIPNCIVDKVPERAEKNEPEIKCDNRRFIIVDDDADIRLRWRKIVQDSGGTVAREASSLEEVEEHDDEIDYGSVDVAMVDYHYEGSKYCGTDVIKYMRTKGVGEIHLCTGHYDDEEVRNEAFSAGADSIIPKG